MAHLTGDGGDRSRAQMILIIGFALAVVFVALAFLLNSVIFTENLATRSESTRTSHAVAVTSDVGTGMASVIGYANEHNTSTYADLEGELVSGNRSIERLANRQQLTSGAVLNLTYLDYTRGTWVDQSYAERNFTDSNQADGAYDADWRLADGVEDTRAFRIHVTDPSKLADTGDGNLIDQDNFTVKATDGTDDWTMEVYRDGGDTVDEVTGTNPYVVEVTDGNGNIRYCSDDSGGAFWINVSAGTMAGDDCRALQFAENVSTPYEVHYVNGDNVYGTYRLMVQNQTTVSTGPYNATGNPPPVTRPAVWNATIHVEFETRTLTYETDVSADPEENDA